MRKFSTKDWKEIPHGQAVEIISGRVFVRATSEISLLVEDENGEALAGTGREIDLTFQPGRLVVATVLAHDEGARVFLYEPYRPPVPKADVVFTNAERTPMESGTMLEIKRAMREFELQKRGALAEMRAERRLLDARKAQTPAPVAEEPAATEEPADETAAE